MLFEPLLVISVQGYVQGPAPRRDGLGGNSEDGFTNLMHIEGSPSFTAPEWRTAPLPVWGATALYARFMWGCWWAGCL